MSKSSKNVSHIETHKRLIEKESAEVADKFFELFKSAERLGINVTFTTPTSSQSKRKHHESKEQF